MPAKETTQVQDNSSQEEIANNQHGLIHKIYDVVLSRDTVMKSVKKIKDTYHDVIVEGRYQIDGIKRKGEEVYVNTRERVKTWCYSITIYNHFTSLWLVKNLPFGSQKMVSYEEFLSAFQNLSKDTSQETEDQVKIYYKEASDLWSNLSDPSLEDIKQACLLITARAIAAEFKIEVDGFSSEVVELFTALDSRKHESASNEAFYVQIRKRIHTKLHNEIDFKRAVDTFYTFAKRFAFLEFPLTYANQDILKVLVKFATERLDILGEIFLNRIDGALNVVIKKLRYEYEEREDAITLFDKYQVILDKLMMISKNSFFRSKRAIQESNTYHFVDKKVHFDERYNDLMLVSGYAYSVAASAFSPAYKAIQFTYNKVANEYVFALYDISKELVKENIANLKKRYEILKDATIKLKDNVLEIKFSKETFDKLTTDAKEQITMIYAEIRTMDAQKLKVIGSQAYKKAMDIIKGGKRAITNGEQETPSEKKQL